MAARPPYRTLGTDLLCMVLGAAVFWLPTGWASHGATTSTGKGLAYAAVNVLVAFPLAYWGVRWIGRKIGYPRHGSSAGAAAVIGVDLAFPFYAYLLLVRSSGGSHADWGQEGFAYMISLLALFSFIWCPGWVALNAALMFEKIALKGSLRPEPPPVPNRPVPLEALLFPVRALGRFFLCMTLGAAVFWAPALAAFALPIEHLDSVMLCVLLALFVSLPVLWKLTLFFQRRYPDRVAPAGVIGGVLLGVNLLPNLMMNGLLQSWEGTARALTEGWTLHPLLPFAYLGTGMILPWLIVHVVGVPTLVSCLRSGRPLPRIG